MKTLRTMLFAGLLVLAAVPMLPGASAVTCVGYGLGGEVAETCNEALETVYGVDSDDTIDYAHKLADQAIHCTVGSLTQAAIYCVHNV